MASCSPLAAAPYAHRPLDPDLVVESVSNCEIASTAQMSPPSVEAHLTKIYRHAVSAPARSLSPRCRSPGLRGPR